MNPQQGSRKQKAFYLSQLLLWGAFISALFFGAAADAVFIAYTGAQAVVVGAFFGANYGEHKQNAIRETAKAQNGNPS